MKRIFTLAASLASLATVAMPEVQNLSVSQNNNCMVEISFALSEKAIVTMDMTTNGVSIGADNYQTVRDAYVNDDKFPAGRAVAAGQHLWTWRPTREWPGFHFGNNEFAVKVQAWSFDNPPDYMVVDYDIRSNITFYATAAEIPDGGIKTADPNDAEALSALTNDIYRLKKIILRKIPAAGVKWRMGSPTDEKYRQDDETPHYVTLTNDYYAAIYPLTKAQCKRFFVTADANSTLVSIFPKSNQSYTNARGAIGSYCWPEDGYEVSPTSGFGKMRGMTGLRFDFLTEAEWEYACRAGTGDSWNGLTEDEVCWHGLSNSSVDHYVGTKKPNEWGLFDMHGLAAEWVLDQYGEYPTDPVIAPQGVTTNANLRVTRGGPINRKYNGSYTSAVSTRSAYRHQFDPTQGGTTAPNGFGVRVSCPAALPDWLR